MLEGKNTLSKLNLGKRFRIKFSVVGIILWLIMGSMTALAQPVNDDFDSAVHIGSLPFTDAINTMGATTASDDPFSSCGQGGQGPTVWYSFTPAQNMKIRAYTTGSDYDTSLSVWSGTRGELTEIACNDEFGDFSSNVAFEADAGQTIFFMIGTYGGAPGDAGNLMFTVDVAIPPANDDFINATMINTLPFSDSISTISATTESSDPVATCGELGGPTVWYAFNPTENMRIRASITGTGYNTVISIWTGTQNALTQLACNLDRPFSEVYAEVDAGETVYFMVGFSNLYTASNAIFTVDAFIPPEDNDFSNATLISTLPYTDYINTMGATTASSDPVATCGAGGQGPTVWYSFTPTENMQIGASTAGSDYNAVISVWTGTQNALNEIACNDYWPSQVNVDVSAGETIYFMIGSYGGGKGGNLIFTVDVPLTIDLSINPDGSVERVTGDATISGSVMCSSNTFVELGGELRQRIGRLDVSSGSFYSNFICNNNTIWTATVRGDKPFAAGKAKVTAHAYAWDRSIGKYIYKDYSSVVQLKGGKP